MRKNIFILLAVLASVRSFGQATEQKFHFGLKVTPALAWLKSDTKEFKSDGSKVGFAYGIVAEFNFGKNYAFATGIDVAYRGGKTKYSTSLVTPGLTTNSTIASKYNLEYIELPLTLKFKTNEIGAVTYYLQAGIQPGFLIRARADVDYDFQFVSNGTTKDSSSSVTDIDIMDNINSLNMSMIIGGGLEYNLSGSTSLLAGLTFSNGLLDVLDASELKAKSNYLGLTVGILF